MSVQTIIRFVLVTTLLILLGVRFMQEYHYYHEQNTPAQEQTDSTKQ